MTRTRITTVLAAALALVAVLAVASSGQPYPPPGPLITIDLTVVTPGATVNIQGTNWGAGTLVEIARIGLGASRASQDGGAAGAGSERSASGGDAEVLVEVPVGADGTFAAEVTLPDDVPAGENMLVAEGVDRADRPQTTSVALTVQDGPTDTDGGATFGAREMLVIAGAVLVLIAIALLLSRRRLTS